ncbi:hypothetical protein Mapa_005893 [Marchantia paleacea]|nr:hypothetical protein Mapa_005893 [Marchantia paleacea]
MRCDDSCTLNSALYNPSPVHLPRSAETVLLVGTTIDKEQQRSLASSAPSSDGGTSEADKGWRYTFPSRRWCPSLQGQLRARVQGPHQWRDDDSPHLILPS